MKSAEQWIKLYYRKADSIYGVNIFVFFKQIQLDAYKAGMSEAAEVVGNHWNDHHQAINQFEQAQRSRNAIITARDKKTKI